MLGTCFPPGSGARSAGAAGTGAGAEDAALERRRDRSGRVHGRAEEALTFEKRSPSPTAIYPAFPVLLLPSLPVRGARRIHGWLSRGCSAVFARFTSREVPRLPPEPSQAASSSWAGAGSRAPSAPAPPGWGARGASASQGGWGLGREQGWTAKTVTSPVHR